MLRLAFAPLALLALAACEPTTGAGNVPLAIDPEAQTISEAINEPTDGAANEIEAE